MKAVVFKAKDLNSMEVRQGERGNMDSSTGFLSVPLKSLGFENFHERFTGYLIVTFGFDPMHFNGQDYANPQRLYLVMHAVTFKSDC